MDIEKRLIKGHLFVCSNKKESGDYCQSKDPEEIIMYIKKRLRAENLWDEYKVTKSGCLGPCARGVSATIYPHNLLITELGINDCEKLYTLLVGEYIEP